MKTFEEFVNESKEIRFNGEDYTTVKEGTYPKILFKRLSEFLNKLNWKVVVDNIECRTETIVIQPDGIEIAHLKTIDVGGVDHDLHYSLYKYCPDTRGDFQGSRFNKQNSNMSLLEFFMAIKNDDAMTDKMYKQIFNFIKEHSETGKFRGILNGEQYNL